MKIASFNANGIRARMPVLLKWLEQDAPDILCIQETRTEDRDFPRKPLEEAGYHCTFRGEKRFNGVAVLSRIPPAAAGFGFLDGDERESARLVCVYFDRIAIVNTYVPQGQDPDSEKFLYKLEWLSRLKRYFEAHFTPGDALIWAGDFNVAPEPIDVYDAKALQGSIGFHPKEHRALSEIQSWGFIDVYRQACPNDRSFTFWDYRIPNALKRGMGWRIDHIWSTACVAEKLKRAWIDAAPRQWDKPSDHTFIAAEFDF